jgi:hypothetical protein
MDDLLGHSITYLVAMGPRAGQKVFSLQTVPGSRRGFGCTPATPPRASGRATGLPCSMDDVDTTRELEMTNSHWRCRRTPGFSGPDGRQPSGGIKLKCKALAKNFALC